MKKNYRMYCFVLSKLTSIDKGIQATHAIVEYTNKYNKNNDYVQWATEDKTLILLDGGIKYQDMEHIKNVCKDYDLDFAYFDEPDLNNLTTAICFLADEEVYDREMWISTYGNETPSIYMNGFVSDIKVHVKRCLISNKYLAK